MGYWPKHQKKNLEALLVEFHEAGWQIERTGYYKVKCPCGSHKRTIHLSPSNPNYANEARYWLHRQKCYKERK